MLKLEDKVPAESNFDHTRLIALDFDGTIADTFTPSPNKIGVEEAYCSAIEEVFGLSALTNYLKEGGLQNRAPVEVVRQLAPDADIAEQTGLLTRLDSAKLGVLLGEIGNLWPQPIPGFQRFVHSLDAVRRKGQLVDAGVSSSGHHSFITRTFETWGFFEPTFILAQEAIQSHAQARGEEMPVKPDVRIIAYATRLWRSLYGISDARSVPYTQDWRRIQYVGDGLVDEQLAVNAGLRFFRIESTAPETSWQRVTDNLGAVHAA